MKVSKKIYLILAILFLISFIFSLFNTETTHKILFWETNIWAYRIFRLVIAVVFMKSYLDSRKEDQPNE
ncbi:hypothetical protein J3S90_13225 [Flavobacterium sp. P4023]|uniref:Uncharacterized protein n=1 Tax=Flavobacterium flabelliforme TaxID=2816119 RepID=A0ABS5CVW9_9FLAO|nr:hypothetical protein [Flavobacterium flabelliforme]MBP4142762.1 hypothetical protein [Flavobacterium flabelliforme]